MQLVPNSAGAELREFNPCHEPGGTPAGGRFSAKGTGNCGPAGLLPEYTQTNPAEDIGRTPQGTEKTLLEGSITNSEELGGGANTSLLVDVEGPDGDFVKAVFKPEVGEKWRAAFSNHDINRAMNNREFSLAAREAAAYDLDQMLGTNLVPETVLRTEVDGVDIPEAEGDDEDYAREQYNEWRDEQVDALSDDVREAMGEQYQEDLREFVSDAENVYDNQLTEIWNKVIDEHPELEGEPYGTDVNAQPVLPEVGFNVRQRGTDVFDPIEAMAAVGAFDELGPGKPGRLSPQTYRRLEAYIEKAMLDEGYGVLGDFDDASAEDYFKPYEEWIDSHAETEAKMYDARIPDFDRWAEERGYNFGGRQINPDAPHPRGGSLQRFVNSTWAGMSDSEKARFAVLDYALGSMDRHGHNFIMTGDGAKAIDNGYTFPDRAVTFRSVPTTDWLSRYGSNGKIETADRQRLLTRLRNSDWSGFAKRYPMSYGERVSFLERIVNLQAALETPDGLRELWRRTGMM